MGRKRKKSGSGKEKLQEYVLSAFHSKPNQALNYKQISKIIGATDGKSKNAILKQLQKLASSGKLQETGPGKYKAVHRSAFATGQVEMTTRGSAFIVNNDFGEDIFIPTRKLRNALHGDIVKVSLFSKRRGKSMEGEILEILERNKTEFVGTIELSESFAFLVPDSNRMHVDLYIPLNKLNGAKNGDKAIGKMKDWPDGASSPFGEVVEVLGRPGEHNTEMSSILVEFGFPLRFPDGVEEIAAKIPTKISQEEIAKRTDFRKTLTFTIDPIDAKDFDDAISYRKLKNGHFEVGVHIADVTHYVHEGDAIDKEAVKRATSVYLVDRVIPMLPEVLSNQVCSLRPNEESLCFACVFEMNENAKVLNYRVEKTVIFSDRRYHYDEVQAILDGKEDENKEALIQVNSLAKKLREERMKSGAIAFSSSEVRFELDENKMPENVIFKIQKDAHKLIEEFMLLANKKVSEFVSKPKDKSRPKTFVYRIHDTPDREKLNDFSAFVKRFGYEFRPKQTANISNSLNQILEEVKGKREASMIEQLAIRTMAKAEYSTDNIGHYGLSFSHYSHFTSPIRRYPDVMAHRLLFHYINGGNSESKEKYEKLCDWSSKMERKAIDAERQSIKYYQVLYLQDKIGEEFDAVVSGMNEFGIYVEISENKCEGMIRMRDIDDDYYYLDEKNYRIIGHNSDRVINLGDELRIKIKKVDLVKRRLDFELVEVA